MPTPIGALQGKRHGPHDGSRSPRTTRIVMINALDDDDAHRGSRRHAQAALVRWANEGVGHDCVDAKPAARANG